MVEHGNFVIWGYHIAELLKHREGKIAISLDFGISAGFTRALTHPYFTRRNRR